MGGVTAGDAIVQGTVNSPLTVGSANNIVIDGNICYADAVSAGTCTAAPAAPSTNVLGLVAENYVEINHPVDSHGNNVSTCSQTLGAGTPTCDLQDPYIDAVLLALNHSVLVNNYDSGNPLGTINLNGTIDQDWRGPVGTFNGHGIVERLCQELPVRPAVDLPVTAVLPEPRDLAVGLRVLHGGRRRLQARHGLAQHRGLHRVPVSRLPLPPGTVDAGLGPNSTL